MNDQRNVFLFYDHVYDRVWHNNLRVRYERLNVQWIYKFFLIQNIRTKTACLFQILQFPPVLIDKKNIRVAFVVSKLLMFSNYGA